MTKMRAVMTLESMEQVGATIEFCRTLNIQVEMGVIQEAPKEQIIQIGGGTPAAKDAGFAKNCGDLLANGPMTRVELVRALAKKIRKDPKPVGMAVKRLLMAGFLEVK